MANRIIRAIARILQTALTRIMPPASSRLCAKGCGQPLENDTHGGAYCPRCDSSPHWSDYTEEALDADAEAKAAQVQARFGSTARWALLAILAVLVMAALIMSA